MEKSDKEELLHAIKALTAVIQDVATDVSQLKTDTAIIKKHLEGIDKRLDDQAGFLAALIPQEITVSGEKS